MTAMPCYNPQLPTCFFLQNDISDISAPVLDPLHLLTEFSLAMHFQIHPEQLITSTGGNRAAEKRRNCALNTRVSHGTAPTSCKPESPERQALVQKGWDDHQTESDCDMYTRCLWLEVAYEKVTWSSQRSPSFARQDDLPS